MKYKHCADGEPVRVGRWAKIACCDCGLVHMVQFTGRDKALVMRAWRDEKATKLKRKARRYECRRVR